MGNTEVTLVINGREYRYWQSVTIQEQLTSYYRKFSVGFTREQLDGSLVAGIEPGATVEVCIGDVKVLTGYVIAARVSYTATGITCSVSGASRTVDLAESYIAGDNAKQFINRTVSEVLAAVAAPYGVAVDYQAPRNPQANISVSATDPIQKLLDGIVKKHSLVLTDNADGNLVVALPGGGNAADDALELGKNILSCEQSVDLSKVFSRYEIYGQQTNAASDKSVSNTSIKKSADTADMSRLRIYAEKLSGSPTPAALERRAALLSAYRWGRAHAVTYEVQGWQQTNGELWPVNGMVHVTDPIIGIDEDWLITEATFSKDSSGTKTKLTLMPLDAFAMMGETTDAEVAKKKSAASASTSTTNPYTKKGTTAEADWTKN